MDIAALIISILSLLIAAASLYLSYQTSKTSLTISNIDCINYNSKYLKLHFVITNNSRVSFEISSISCENSDLCMSLEEQSSNIGLKVEGLVTKPFKPFFITGLSKRDCNYFINKKNIHENQELTLNIKTADKSYQKLFKVKID